MKKGTTDYIFSLDDSQYSGILPEMKMEDVYGNYRTLLYGYIEDLDNEFDKWENPKNYGNGDATCVVKIGQIQKIDAIEYKGMTVKESVNHRVQQQSNPSARTNNIPVFVVATNVPGKADDKFRDYIRTEFTHLTKLQGELIDGISKSNIKKYYNAWKSGIKNRTNNFELNTNQKICKDKIIKVYNNGGKYFLFGAKPRFGKNFTILKTALGLNIKNILFVSYSPTVFASLSDDVNTHIDFNGWKYVNYRNIENRNINPYNGITPTVVSTSAQLLNYADDEEGMKDVFSINDMNDFRDSLKNFSSYNVDLLVFDEAHFGGSTDNANNIISTINPKFTIFVTGTDLNFKNDDRFNNTNTFEYDYIDECNDTDERAKMMPKFRIYTYKMDKHFVELCKKEYKSEEFPTFRKLFMTTNKGKFVYKEFVEVFFKSVFGKREFDEGGRLAIKTNSISPYQNKDIDNIDHAIATMPTVASIKASIKLLKEMHIDDEFEFIDASGSDGYKDINDVKDIIKKCKSKHKKSVTFTCKRFKEGVTVPEWHAVFFFNDNKSFNEYIQTMFRGQSFELNKHFCYIFDYNPERCLKIRYENIRYHRKEGYSKSEMKKTLNDCMPIMYYNTEGNLVSNEELNAKINDVCHNSSFADGFGSMGYSYINIPKWNFCDNDKIKKMFNGITSTPTHSSTIDGNTNNIKGGKLYNSEHKKIKETPKNPQRDINNLIKKCIEVLKSIPEFLFVCNKRYNHIIDSLTNENRNKFNIITSFDMDDFCYILKEGYINVEYIDDSMEKFYKDKEDMFDIPMLFLDDTMSIEEVKKEIDKFRSKWIYEKGENRDVPFCLINSLNI